MNLLDWVRCSHTDCIQDIKPTNEERTQAHLNANRAKQINDNREKIGWRKQ